MEIFQSHNIVKKFANHTALDGVSISVPEQSVFGLLGPNGAGKTTFIRIINQITAPDSGELIFKGEKLEVKHSEQIGYLPEERGLYKKMKVGEQVLYLSQLKGLTKAEAKKRLKNWLQKFEIEAWENKKIEELSKGMQQKVQFITTVLHEPELLILDEPFSGFDPINAVLIRNEILKLKEKGATVILSTHNMSSVEELCDNIALIHRSKKILDGSVKEIRKTYKSNIYEVEFSGNIFAFTTSLGSRFELIEKEQQDKNCFKAKVKLLQSSSSNDLLQTILPSVQVQAFKEIIPSMNDIFISKIDSENAVASKVEGLTE